MKLFKDGWSLVCSAGKYHAITDTNEVAYSFDLGDETVPAHAMNAALRMEWFYNIKNQPTGKQDTGGSLVSRCH